MAARANAAPGAGDDLLLADLVLAECVYVLESFYEVPQRASRGADARRDRAHDDQDRRSQTLLRALEVYEVHRIDFADAYLVAQAEAPGVGTVLSFDKTIDRVDMITPRAP